jgi:Flp pilus assembly protein TadG
VDTLNLKRRTHGHDAGSELVELAIVMPILVLLLLGIVDFAFLFQRWEVVTNATREGARLASLGTANQPGGYDTADISARVQSFLDAGGLNSSPTVGVDWTTTDTVGTVVVNTVTVSVTYPSAFIFMPGTINLNSASEMRLENGQ